MYTVPGATTRPPIRRLLFLGVQARCGERSARRDEETERDLEESMS